MLESVTTGVQKRKNSFLKLPSYTLILVGQKSPPGACPAGGTAAAGGHPRTEGGRVGLRGSVGGAGSCAQAEGQTRATVARIALPGPTTEPPPPGQGRTRPAGPRGGAGRQLDPAAIYGPFRRAGASSGRSLSHGLHNGAAAAVEPPPPCLEACTGTTPDRGGAGVPDPFIHLSIIAAIYPSFHPRIHQSFFHLSTHPSMPPPPHAPMHACIPAQRPCTSSVPACVPPGPAGQRGPCVPTVRPRLRRPLLLHRRAPGSPPGWHGQRRRVRVEHTGAHSSGLRATICQIRVDAAAPRSFRRRTSRNSEQSQLCSCLLWMRTGREKKNHLTPRDSQLITNHM